MDCFQDFCLNCDRQSTGGPYCSQACRLADLEKASAPSSPISPTSTSSSASQQSAWRQVGLGIGSNYVLAPAYQFPEPARGYGQPSSTDDRRPQTSYFMSSPHNSRQGHQPNQRSLTPSSSRSSLSSITSTSNTNVISDEAKQQLQEYFNSFDQTRATRRRQSAW